MTDLTTSVQKASLGGAAPNYVAVSAADFFSAGPGEKYLLHYKNGATPTGAGTFKVVDATTPTPASASPGAGFADAVVQNGGMLATTELVSEIDNTNRFRDANKRVNLTHTGTLTTVTVAIIGPL